MSDDLVTRLRDGKLTWGDRWEATARIESDAATIARLEGERDSASGLALTLQAECERLHGDVAALVEALERIAAGMGGYSAGELARAAIAAAKEGNA